MVDRLEFRQRYLNRVLYILDARIQMVEGISSRLDGSYAKHRILWDLDDCSYEEAIRIFNDIQLRYDLDTVRIISDKNRSYGGVCNTVVSFKDLLHILIDTELIDPLYVGYTLRRHEAVLRLSTKEDRDDERRIICELYRKSGKEINDRDYFMAKYQTGYSKRGMRKGDFTNEQKII